MDRPRWIAALALAAALAPAAACLSPEEPASLAGEEKNGASDSVCRETSLSGIACRGCGLGELAEAIGEILCEGSPSGPSPIDGNCSFAVVDLETGEAGSWNGDHPVWAMSTIKFIIVAAALYNGVPPWSIDGLADDIFISSSNVAPARVLDALHLALEGGADVPATTTSAANAVNELMHDVIGMSEASTFTRWCQPGETCHLSTNCTGAAAGRCGSVTNILTAEDAVLFLRWVWEGDFPGRSALLEWSAPREQESGRLGLRSCGMESVLIHHKIGSSWEAETSNLIYSDIGIIEVPGRAPILVAALDGWHGHRGQEGHLAGALYSYVRTGVADFDLRGDDGGVPGEADPDPDPVDPSPGSDDDIDGFCAEMGQIDTCAPTDDDPDRIGYCDGRGFRSCPFGCHAAPTGTDDECLPDPRAACASVSYIDTCSPRFAGTLLRCDDGGEMEWVRCPAGCLAADYGEDDACR